MLYVKAFYLAIRSERLAEPVLICPALVATAMSAIVASSVKILTDLIGDRCQLVGDDLFVTNVKYLQKGIEMGCANSILVRSQDQ